MSLVPSPDTPGKVCIQCDTWKPLTEYYAANRNQHDRLEGTCKACKAKLAADRRRRDPLAHQVRSKTYLKAHPAVKQAAQRRFHTLNPLAKAAHAIVRIALQVGILIKPETCQRCPSQFHLHAHHADYRKPLEVEWVCALCHGKLRRKIA